MSASYAIPTANPAASLPPDLVASPNRLLSTVEVAAYLGIRPKSIYNYRKNPSVNFPDPIRIRAHGQPRYKLGEIDQFVLQWQARQNQFKRAAQFAVDMDGIPYALIGKILGIAEISAAGYVSYERKTHRTNSMKDRKVPTLVAFLQSRWRRQFEREAYLKLRDRIRRLLRTLYKWHRENQRKMCSRCEKPVHSYQGLRKFHNAIKEHEQFLKEYRP